MEVKMDNITFYDEEKEEQVEMSKDEFVSDESWQLPFEIVKQQADEHEDIRMDLYHQLLRRAKQQPYIDQIKSSGFYDQLVNEILSGDSLLDKIDLALYFDHDFIETIFSGLYNLTDEIVNYDRNDELYTELAMRLVEISKFDIDDETKELIISGIDTLTEKSFKEMNEIGEKFGLPQITGEELEKIKESTKQSYLYNVEANFKHYEK
jgi:hypothetical protein